MQSKILKAVGVSAAGLFVVGLLGCESSNWGKRSWKETFIAGSAGAADSTGDRGRMGRNSAQSDRLNGQSGRSEAVHADADVAEHAAKDAEHVAKDTNHDKGADHRKDEGHTDRTGAAKADSDTNPVAKGKSEASQVSDNEGADQKAKGRGNQGVAAEASAKPAGLRKPGGRKMGRGMIRYTMAYPTGERATSAVLLEKDVPEEVAMNTPFDYTIKVTNLTSMTLHNVKVTDAIHSNFSVRQAEPKMVSEQDKKCVWELNELAPRQSRVISIRGAAQSMEAVESCTSVTYSAEVCSSISVVKPMLAMDLSQPKECLVCDDIRVVFNVNNPGNGTARDVKINIVLPEGLTAGGENTLSLRAGTLSPGQSRQLPVRVKASKPGSYTTKASASSANGIKTDVVSKVTVVRQPVLTVSANCPTQVFLGREGKFEYLVKNNGDAVAADAVLEVTVPNGARFMSASDDGRMASGKVRWNLGSIGPNESRTVSIRAKSDKPGDGATTATVKAYCADVATATATSKMVGIPAILMEVVDLNDPVLVGDRQVYLITITNQGTAPDRGIKIVCTLDEGVTFVAAAGATEGAAKGKQVIFETVKELAPKKKVSWRVTVKSSKAGDSRFKVSMTTDELTRPVEETEATNFYK